MRRPNKLTASTGSCGLKGERKEITPFLCSGAPIPSKINTPKQALAVPIDQKTKMRAYVRGNRFDS